MKFLRDLFSDEGHASCMRVMAMMCCMAAIAIAIVGLSRQQVDYSGLTLLVGTFLTVAFTGKVAQKHFETKSTNDEKKS